MGNYFFSLPRLCVPGIPCFYSVPTFIAPRLRPGASPVGLVSVAEVLPVFQLVMSHPIRFGIIGCGGIGNVHRAAVQSLEDQGRARLCAVADPYRAQLSHIHAALETRGTRWYLDYREMLAEEQLDLVVVATPIPLHYQMALDCLATGARILLEKPPVPLLTQLDDLISRDQEHRVWVGFQMIHTLPVRQVKELICSGALGRVKRIRAAACWPRSESYYKRAGWAGKMILDGKPVYDGPATNALAHLLHNTMYFASPEQGEYGAPLEVQAELYRVRPIESYDTFCVRARLSGDIEFSAAFTHAGSVYCPYYIEVEGTHGRARIDEKKLQAVADVPLPFGARGRQEDVFLRMYEDLADTLQKGDCTPHTRLRDARGFVQLTNAALASSGGIHSVTDPSLAIEGEGELRVYSVADLDETIQRSAREGRLLSDFGGPWKGSSRSVTLETAPDVEGIMHRLRVGSALQNAALLSH